MPVTGTIPCPRCKETSGHTGFRMSIQSIDLDLGYNAQWRETGETHPKHWITCGSCGYAWTTRRDLGGYG